MKHCVCFVSIFSLFFFSCSKSNSNVERDAVEVASRFSYRSHFKQQDIPVPVGFSLAKCDDREAQSSLCYSGKLGVAESIRFYKRAMECNGWNILDFSGNDEGLFVCNKANKRCAITIRPSRGYTSKTNIRIALREDKNHETIPFCACADTINSKEIVL